MTRLAKLVVVVGLFTSAAMVKADDDLPCAGYEGHLLQARVELENGKRQQAIEQLKMAREALASCLREAGEEVMFASLEGALIR